MGKAIIKSLHADDVDLSAGDIEREIGQLDKYGRLTWHVDTRSIANSDADTKIEVFVKGHTDAEWASHDEAETDLGDGADSIVIEYSLKNVAESKLVVRKGGATAGTVSIRSLRKEG